MVGKMIYIWHITVNDSLVFIREKLTYWKFCEHLVIRVQFLIAICLSRASYTVGYDTDRNIDGNPDGDWNINTDGSHNEECSGIEIVMELAKMATRHDSLSQTTITRVKKLQRIQHCQKTLLFNISNNNNWMTVPTCVGGNSHVQLQWKYKW